MAVVGETLTDECDALNAIYGSDTIVVTDSSTTEVNAVVRLPNVPFSFLFSFPTGYPDAPLAVRGTHSIGSGEKGAGDRAVSILVDALSSVYIPGSVCLFDLFEEAGPRLEEHSHDTTQDTTEHAADRSEASTRNGRDTSLTGDPAASTPPPPWILSETLLINKSTFVARALRVSSMTDVTDAVSHLLSTNKKVATATHNIKAWRIKQEGSTGIMQDHDDDGETAAGGRLLHLMQLMNAQNVLVVVTRWYGGVKLGPDRFRLINNVAREVLTTGGFVDDEKSKGKKDKK